MKMKTITKTILAVVTISAISIAGFEIFYAGSLNHSVNAETSSSPPNLPPATPRNGIPPFEISLNGSSVYPSYTVTRGQNIVIFVDVTSKQPYLVSLNAHYQSANRVLPNGIVLNLPMSSATLPVSHIPMSISISDNTVPGVYPMAIDASYYNSTDGGHVGFQAGFNLNIQG